MNLEEYQKFCRTTDLFPLGPDNPLIFLIEYRTLGLNGEVGELSEKILDMVLSAFALSSTSDKLANVVKKIRRDSPDFLTPKTRRSMVDELGDMMWYISILCDLLDVSLEYVLHRNAVKLTERKAQNKIRGEGDNRSCNGPAVPHEWKTDPETDEEKCRWCGVHKEVVHE